MSEPYMNFPVISFGEILWKIMPTGTMAAGAPMNVVYHLRNLGVNPTIITRVGLDAQGKRLIELLESQNISTDFFQLDNELPTGRINAATLVGNEPGFDIQKPAAWDNIGWDEGFETLLKSSRFFVFGSLAVRSTVSSKTLFQLLEIAPYKVLDLNLHAPHFSRRSVEDILKKTDLLKLNVSELELITGWFTRYNNETDRMQILQDKFQIENIIVTLGSKGSVMNTNGGLHRQDGFAVQVADTMGSSDAFLAGLLYKMSHSVKMEESHTYANALGSLVASKPGSCPGYTFQEIEEIISNNKNVTLPSH